MTKAPARLRCTEYRFQQAGFSLIELMIALTIGLMLVAGLGMILFGVRGTYLTQDGLTRMQEGERYLLTSLNNSVQTAGYFVDPVGDTILNALPQTQSPANNPDGTTFALGQAISGTTGGGSASDTINTRYQSANEDAINCLGGVNTSKVPVLWVNSYFLDSSKKLKCTVTTIGAGAPSPVTDVLVDEVVQMTVRYGVGANDDGQISRYLTSNDVTAAGVWSDVVSVKITLLQTDLVNRTPGNPNLTREPLVHVINLMNKSANKP